jgi:RNA-directed DNA polymerase
MVLEAVYEQDFLDCSYGFRPGRSAHQALNALWKGLMDMGGGWVVEVDIERYFDTIDHGRLRSFLDQRVRDGVIRRAIDKWLKAGVLEGGNIEYPDEGTPQGGVISPLLANIYLHEVLDRWFEREVKPRLHGRAMLVRYADDAVLAFQREDDARRVMAVLEKRMARYGLKLHPEKTRLVEFRRPKDGSPRAPGSHPRRSFDLLGFTHHWGKSRKGYPVVQRKTASNRFSRALNKIAQWCRWHRHRPVAEQHAQLVLKLRGHYAYYGITGNGYALGRFVHEVERVWRHWLDRRSNHAKMNWERFARLRKRFPMPPVRVVHSIYRTAAKP